MHACSCVSQSHVFKVNDDRIVMFGWTIIVVSGREPLQQTQCVLLSTSGARYSGVPQNVFMVASSVIPSLQRPKSVIFMCPSLSSMRFSSWVNREHAHHRHITTLLSSEELLCLYNSSKNWYCATYSILSVLINFTNKNSSSLYQKS